jgi:hypothetical protein
MSKINQTPGDLLNNVLEMLIEGGVVTVENHTIAIPFIFEAVEEMWDVDNGVDESDLAFEVKNKMKSAEKLVS